MEEEKGIGWVWLSESKEVFDGAGKLWGFTLKPSSDGGVASIYAAREARTERIIGAFKGKEDDINSVMFSKPLELEDGLFVEFTSHMDNVFVLFEL